MDPNPTSQVIEQNIIDLLGLQDDYELSWEDYFRALREAAAAARMNESKYSSDDTQRITEELKRVKGVKKETVFKTSKKKKKVKRDPIDPTKVTNISKFVDNSKRKSNNNARPVKSLVGTGNYKPPTTPVEDQTKKEEPKPNSDSLLSILKNIDKTVGSILTTLENQLAFQRKSADSSRRSSERSRAESKEDEMESVSSEKKDTPIIIKAAEKVLSPLQQLFQRIKNFLFWMFAAKAFKMFSEWFSDPNNQKKVVNIIMFLRDHWVLLVGSWLAFGTSIGRFITGFAVKLGVWTAKMAVVIAKKLIPVIGQLGAKGKIAALAGLGLGAVAVGKSLMPGEKPSSGEAEAPPNIELPTPPSEPIEKFEKGGIAGSLGKAIEYSPLGLMFKAGKSGAENLGKIAPGISGGLHTAKEGVGKATEFASSGIEKTAGGAFKGIGGLALNALKYSPIGLGLSLGKKGLETAGDISSNLSSLPIAASLGGLGGIGSILGLGLLKDSKVKDQFNQATEEVKTSGLDKDPKFIQMGGLPGLANLILQKTGPEVEKQSKDASKTSSFNIGGVVDRISSGDGVPITGAGKDDTLIKANIGDAILTEKDQSLLTKAMSGVGIGGALGGSVGSLTNASSSVGGPTTIAVKKGEAILSPDVQQSIYNKFGINIPAWLSKRKPQKVDSDNIKTKGGKTLSGFSNGGIIHGFSNGGIAGGTSVLNLGKKISGNPDHKFDPTLAKSVPLLYKMIQSGRFKEKGWGDKKFMDQLTARLLVESANFSRSKEMYDSDSRDPKGKEGYHYFGEGYGNRSDLGNKGFDDGYNFRGRGAIQLTGRSLYEGMNKWLAKNGYKGIDVVKNPDLLATDPKIQALSTLYYLEDREKKFGVSFADMAKQGDSESFTYNINGGYNHLAETQDNLRRIQGLSGGVNYGTGFSPAAPKPASKPAQGNPIMNIASRAMSSIGNFFAPPASAGSKPPSRSAAPKPTSKPAPPPPKRWAVDPRGWIGKKDGGIIGGVKSGLSSIGSGLLNLISSPAKAATSKPKIKPKPITTPSSGNTKQGSSGVSRRRREEMKIASLIKVAPIENMPDRSTTGFRDLAESQYEEESRNNFSSNTGVRGLQDGGIVDLENSINKSTEQYRNQPSQSRETSLGIPLIRNNPLQSLQTISNFAKSSLGFIPKAASSILHESSQMIPKKQSGGLIDFGSRGLSIQNPERHLKDRYGIDVNTQPQSRDVDFNEPFRNLGEGMRSLGGRARNLFSPFSNLFGRKPKRPRVTETSRKLENRSNSFFPSGLIKENTGLDIPGGTADKQLTALQPGEYVIPKDSVNRLGKGFFDHIVGSTDSNSSPVKEGLTNDIFKTPVDLGLNTSSLKTNFDASKVKNNTSTTFNPNVNPNVNPNPKKKSSISDTLNELRGMRSNSLERQGRLGEAYGLRGFGTGVDFSSISKNSLGSSVDTGFKIRPLNNTTTYDLNKSKNNTKFTFNSGNLTGSNKKSSSALDPTKTAASMPHVYAAARAARERARLEGLSPQEVEKRVVEASIKAKEDGPSKSFNSQIDWLSLFNNKPKSSIDTNVAFNPSANLNGNKNVNKKESIDDTLNQLRGMRSNSLERQGRLGEAYGLRAFGTGINFSQLSNKSNAAMAFDPNINLNSNKPKESVVSNNTLSADSNKLNPYNVNLGLNIPSTKSNFDSRKIKNNASLAFNPNVNLNINKKESIDDRLNQLRGMRSNSLERQGRLGESYGLRGFGTGMNFSSLFTKGLVMENSGIDIPGGTADRQFTALQPGEYVIPKDSVDRLGKGFFDGVVGSTDSNSSPAKLGKTLNTIGNKIKPYEKPSEGRGGIAKLPPIKSGGNASGGGGQKAGQKEVMFDPLCTNPSAVTERQRIQDTYGIVSPF